MDWKDCAMKQSWLNLRFPNFLLKSLKKTIKSLFQNIRGNPVDTDCSETSGTSGLNLCSTVSVTMSSADGEGFRVQHSTLQNFLHNYNCSILSL
jgi:hypothetical protein